MLGKELDAITKVDRQTGKIGDLSAGFGGSVGAWRRQIVDERSDFEIKADIEKWRRAHPRIVKFWHDLARCIRIAIKTGQSVYVGTPPVLPITAHFEAGNLYLTLPSGRAITYPEAHLVPSKFEGYPPDVAFKDNARRQWKDVRGWHGTFTENVVQGTARDILVAAIARMEARGLPVVLHVHDDLVVEAPIGAVSPEEFQRLALEPVPWAARTAVSRQGPGRALLSGRAGRAATAAARRGRHRRDGARQLSRRRAHRSLPQRAEEEEDASDEGEDDDAFLDDLDSNSAPLRDFVSLPLTDDGKIFVPVPRRPDAVAADLPRPLALLRLPRTRRPDRLAGPGRRHEPRGSARRDSRLGSRQHSAERQSPNRRPTRPRGALTLWDAAEPCRGA